MTESYQANFRSKIGEIMQEAVSAFLNHWDPARSIAAPSALVLSKDPAHEKRRMGDLASQTAEIQNGYAMTLVELTAAIGRLRTETDTQAFHRIAVAVLLDHKEKIPGWQDLVMRADLAYVPDDVARRIMSYKASA
ncbi:MAG: hypothetical protein DI629_17640 [Mesorhizobium amorphae]|nr:MAG: hypothetical protein DI629_17640 [Mesorhizobium amorphae]